MTDEQRSPAARARAETALVRLLHEMGDEAPFLVVLGGLVPAVLARDTTGVIPEHPQDRFARGNCRRRPPRVPSLVVA